MPVPWPSELMPKFSLDPGVYFVLVGDREVGSLYAVNGIELLDKLVRQGWLPGYSPDLILRYHPSASYTDIYVQQVRPRAKIGRLKVILSLRIVPEAIHCPF